MHLNDRKTQRRIRLFVRQACVYVLYQELHNQCSLPSFLIIPFFILLCQSCHHPFIPCIAPFQPTPFSALSTLRSSAIPATWPPVIGSTSLSLTTSKHTRTLSRLRQPLTLSTLLGGPLSSDDNVSRIIKVLEYESAAQAMDMHSRQISRWTVDIGCVYSIRV